MNEGIAMSRRLRGLQHCIPLNIGPLLRKLLSKSFRVPSIFESEKCKRYVRGKEHASERMRERVQKMLPGAKSTNGNVLVSPP